MDNTTNEQGRPFPPSLPPPSMPDPVSQALPVGLTSGSGITGPAPSFGTALKNTAMSNPLAVPAGLMGAAASHIPTAISSHINPNAQSAPQEAAPYLPDVTSSHPGNNMSVETTPMQAAPVLLASTGAKPITFPEEQGT
jgi:hypothetical protein